MIDFIKCEWFNIITLAISIIAVSFSYHFYKENKKFTKRQQFDSSFYNMLNELDKIVGNISLNKIYGRDVFEFLYLNLEMTYNKGLFYDVVFNDIKDIMKMDIKPEEKKKKFNNLYPKFSDLDILQNKRVQLKGIKTLIDTFGIEGFYLNKQVEKFKPYFDYVSSIISKVDKTELKEKGKVEFNIKTDYINMIKAKLTPYEQVYLFYYGLTIDGYRFKKLAEKYSFFSYLNTNLLANSMRDERLNLYNDGFGDDAERFVSDDETENDKYRSTIFSTILTYI